MQRFDPGCSGNSCAKKSVDLAGDAGGKPAGRIKAVYWVGSRSDTVISLQIKSSPSKALDQAKPQHDPAVKIALYTLVGTLGTAVFSAIAQIVVAWLQR